jgi:hypothetical protein
VCVKLVTYQNYTKMHGPKDIKLDPHLPSTFHPTISGLSDPKYTFAYTVIMTVLMIIIPYMIATHVALQFRLSPCNAVHLLIMKTVV